MSERPPVRERLEASTMILEIDREKVRNALNWETTFALGEAFERAGVDEDVRTVVVTGAGDAFSAGGDVRDQLRRASWPSAQHIAGAPKLLAAIRKIHDCPKPTVAALNGVAAGGGTGLALLCDIRVAARSARLGFVHPKVGLGPDFGISWTLPRLVGYGMASKLLFTAAMVDAETAHRIGLVEEVVDDALDHSLRLCDTIAELAPLSIRWAKTGLRRSVGLSFAEAIDAEMEIQHIARHTDDHREGVEAFLEGRPPNFKGR